MQARCRFDDVFHDMIVSYRYTGPVAGVSEYQITVLCIGNIDILNFYQYHMIPLTNANYANQIQQDDDCNFDIASDGHKGNRE
jgi:hypothetical protein